LTVSEARSKTFYEDVQRDAVFLDSDSRFCVTLRNVAYKRKIDSHWNAAQGQRGKKILTIEGAEQLRQDLNDCLTFLVAPLRFAHIMKVILK
jgi:hypothetical protein